MRWPAGALIIVMLSALAPPAAAQTWPSKPVQLVVNFGVGGSPDMVARLFGPLLSEAIGQPVVVENRAGAGGNLGIEAVARAAPDGHTFLVSASSPFVIGPHLYKLNFDPARRCIWWCGRTWGVRCRCLTPRPRWAPVCSRRLKW